MRIPLADRIVPPHQSRPAFSPLATARQNVAPINWTMPLNNDPAMISLFRRGIYSKSAQSVRRIRRNPSANRRGK